MLRYSFMVRSVTRPFHLPLRMQQWENQGKSNGFSESYQEFDDLKGFKLHTCFLSLDPKSQIVRSVWKDLSFDPENHSFRRSPDLFYRFRWFRSGGSKAESNLTNVQLITINIYIYLYVYIILYTYIYIYPHQGTFAFLSAASPEVSNALLRSSFSRRFSKQNLSSLICRICFYLH